MTDAVEVLQHKFQSGMALPFGAALSDHALKELFEAEGMRWRDRLFTPVVTLWTFVASVGGGQE
jgi:hypothetical protein